MSKLNLKELDKVAAKRVLEGRISDIEKELESYNNMQGKIMDISMKNIKGANWLVWIWAIPLFIWSLPFLLGYFISLYIEKFVKTIFRVSKRLTYALIRDIVKFIKSKFGNKL
jgi:hypothetical protein